MSLTPKTKNWGNNHLSRRFGKYSFNFKFPENNIKKLWFNCKEFNFSRILTGIPVVKSDGFTY
jgi:hypothetical protein